MSHAHASYAALLGLVIHTFFDGVAIASGLLVSTSLGVVIFLAIFLHKLPEGFTVASLMLASGQSRRAAFWSSAILGGATLLGMALMFALGDVVCGGVGPDPGGKQGTRPWDATPGISRRSYPLRT
jgi:zinc transporter ZupT